MIHELQITNRQRKRPVSRKVFERVATRFLDRCIGDSPCSLGVHLVGAREMTRINHQFLGHAGSTDVITFDHRDPDSADTAAIHGELFICVHEAVAQAAIHRTHWTDEIVRYFIHGVLHLLGHDDRTTADRRVMKRHENRWMRSIRKEFDLSGIAGPTAIKTRNRSID